MTIVETVADPAFRADILQCFETGSHAISARWLYDRRGSEIFEEITKIPEYYPTRVETALLEQYCTEVAGRGGAQRAVVEFGSGSSTKTPHLLRAVDASAYVPIDISGEFLTDSVRTLERAFPNLDILPVEADFMKPFALPAAVSGHPKLGFFPGSTIGNMVARTSVDLLRAMRETLGENSLLLIGFDRIKDTDILHRAYDDAKGVTARFSLNLLDRINGELDGNIPVHQFDHVAQWNDVHARIEIYLEAQNDVDFIIEENRFSMIAGDRIHIENSHKYGLRDARLMLRAGGWTPLTDWSDEDAYFSLILAEAKPFKNAP